MDKTHNLKYQKGTKNPTNGSMSTTGAMLSRTRKYNEIFRIYEHYGELQIFLQFCQKYRFGNCIIKEFIYSEMHAENFYGIAYNKISVTALLISLIAENKRAQSRCGTKGLLGVQCFPMCFT